MKLCLKDSKIQNLTWCKELLGCYLSSHIEESTIPSCLGKRKFLIFKRCCVLNNKQLCKGNHMLAFQPGCLKGVIEITLIYNLNTYEQGTRTQIAS
jgi:hypothetical protein